jgi:hypothetical protein
VHAGERGPEVVDLDLGEVTEDDDGPDPSARGGVGAARYRGPEYASPVVKWAPVMGSWVAFVMQIQGEAFGRFTCVLSSTKILLPAMCTPLPHECVGPE